MHRLFYLFIGLLIPSLTVSAQTPTDAVKAAVTQLFTAMRNADSTALKACFAPDARLQSVTTKSKDVQTTSVDEFASIIGKLPANAADERIEFGNISIDGTMASVWTPYRFYFKQQFHHCGANSFQMVQLDGKWKIQYILDTRRMDDCGAESAAK